MIRIITPPQGSAGEFLRLYFLSFSQPTFFPLRPFFFAILSKFTKHAFLSKNYVNQLFHTQKCGQCG